jgi:ribosome-binding protein aMBF1 (putative translation factor)
MVLRTQGVTVPTMTVPQLIQRHRAQKFDPGATKCWTQQDLATALGWEVHTVQRLEQGQRPLKLAEAVRVSDVLGIEWAALEEATRAGGGA